MPTTSNFGWTTPADTDLVKDGAAAIRTLGNGVDSSFVDLKGGTTDQVLAKNSNTDLDYKWVTPTTGMTNPMTTTGDIIYSSSGSTPARLAIGSTGNVLKVSGGVPTWGAPAAGLTKITTATLTSNTATWDIDNVFSTTYDNYLVSMQIKTDQDLNLRWLKSGTAQTTDYKHNWFKVANASLSGSDVGTTQHFLISGTDADGGNDNYALGELQIGRVGISSANCGNIMSRVAGGLGGQNTFNGSRIWAGSAITITGIRLFTSSTRILSGSTLTVYGLEK